MFKIEKNVGYEWSRTSSCRVVVPWPLLTLGDVMNVVKNIFLLGCFRNAIAIITKKSDQAKFD